MLEALIKEVRAALATTAEGTASLTRRGDGAVDYDRIVDLVLAKLDARRNAFTFTWEPPKSSGLLEKMPVPPTQHEPVDETPAVRALRWKSTKGGTGLVPVDFSTRRGEAIRTLLNDWDGVTLTDGDYAITYKWAK